MVTTFAFQTPVTPLGKPVTLAPVAPVVLYVIFVIAVLMQTVCDVVDGRVVNVIVLFAVTVIVPVALTVPQPPVNGIL